MQDVLEQAGLSKNEAKAYLALSRIGQSTAYAVAKEANTYKANTYDALKRLEEENLVTKQESDGTTLYEAADPSFILDLIDRKREDINQAIPQLRQLQQAVQQDSVFNVYKGSDALINVLRGMLRHNKPILVWGAPKKAYEVLRHRITRFHEERVKQRIKMYHIYNFDANQRIRVLEEMPYTPVRKLPKLYDATVSSQVCGDEVVFAIWSQPMKVIQIIDEEMAEAYRKYFELLWEQAEH